MVTSFVSIFNDNLEDRRMKHNVLHKLGPFYLSRGHLIERIQFTVMIHEVILEFCYIPKPNTNFLKNGAVVWYEIQYSVYLLHRILIM